MKKLITLITVVLISLNMSFAQNSSSDSKISFGAKAGVNFASVSEDDDLDTKGKIGFHVGAVVQINISEKFSLQPEVMYSQQGYKFDYEYVDSDFSIVDATGVGHLDYINIPIMAGYQVIDGLTVQAGPQFGINLTAKETYDEGDDFDFKDETQTLDIALGFGAQYKLPMGLFFQARFTLGMNKIIKDDDFDLDIKNRVAGLSIGYFFN